MWRYSIAKQNRLKCRMQKFTVPIPLSLYIHLPWCVRKCPYCDFNSHSAPETLPEKAYVEALLADLKEQFPFIDNRCIQSIFFGGGTPSLFSAAAVNDILSEINRLLRMEPTIEITLEANPGTIDESRFAGFKAAGINRLSLGVQSLQDEKLKQLGRIHGRDQALRAIESAQSAGFQNINIDLMHGLPGQSLEDALEDLNDALAFNTPHLSWYQLTIEPNTFFHTYPPPLPPDETLWMIQEEGKKLINTKMQGYEISAYALPGKECRHNLNYWEFGDYVGIGAGAHSKITDFEKQHIIRHWQMKNPRDYLNPEKSFTAEKKVITPPDVIFEFMLNALRLKEGVLTTLFTERTGLPTHMLEPALSLAKQKNLLCDEKNRLKPTSLGFQFLNDLIGMFLPG